MASKRDNLREFEKWLSKLSEEMKKEAQETVSKYTELIADETKKRAPYDTGILEDSISTFYSTDGYTGYVYTNIEYAIYQEFGTIHIPAQEFMYRSYTKYFDDFIRELKDKGLKMK